MRYLLDTSALLVHYRQEFDWKTVQAILEDSETELTLASPSLTEFARRLRLLGLDEAAVEETLQNYRAMFRDVVAIDEHIALAAYHIIQMTPKRLPLIDALIAAAAQNDEAILVHRDAHMAAIPAASVRQKRLA